MPASSQPSRRRRHPLVPRLRAALWAVFLLLAPLPAAAQDRAVAHILILLSATGPIYADTVAGIQEGLTALPDSRQPDIKVIPLDQLSGDLSLQSFEASDLVVTVGSRAAAWGLVRAGPRPTLSILIPEATYQSLLRNAGPKPGQPAPGPRSAIYLDQPIGRQLDLIRAALPDRRRVGVLLGPVSQTAADSLAAQAAVRHMHIHTATVQSRDDSYAALMDVLTDSDVLLALPDPEVFNPQDLEGILLTTYHQEVPVIGFSHAYVRAGALASVFSTPRQIGLQAGRMIAHLTAAGGPLPEPQFPTYFTVAVNHQVARSLGIDLPDGEELQRRLIQLERKQP